MDISGTEKTPPALRREYSEWIVEQLPTGVCEVALDDGLTLLYANRSFFQMYGYTQEQFRQETGNVLVRTIWPADLAGVRAVLNAAQEAGKEGFESEHRIMRRDGTIQWSLVRGNFAADRRRIFCVTVDITGRRAMEEALRVNEERFRIALAQTDNTIFDYDIETRRMLHADKAAEKYGLDPWTEDVPDSLVRMGMVHQDSAGEFLEMYRQIRSGAPKASCVVRTRLAGGQYAWRRISMTNVFDGEGKAVRAVGILEDIDVQKRREEDLRRRSERDALTGLYNKGATESRITEILRAVPDKLHALLIVDIDEFKNVNDFHGHPFGDRTLAESARRISALFHSSDVIGRIGGDEFIIFMKSLRNLGIVRKRGLELCQAFDDLFESNGDTARVTCSVGAAVCPGDGVTFDELYQKADIALYSAKKSGKNTFRLFAPGMDTEAWTPYSNTIIDAPWEDEEK